MYTKALLAVGLIALATNLYLTTTATSSGVEEKFQQFIQDQRRSYFSKDEYSFRLGVFSKNLQKIDEMNANPNDDAEYGVNHFSDWTDEEFQAILGLKNMPLQSTQGEKVIDYVDPNRLQNKDWKTSMNGVRNQGSCGSCWSFAAVATQEAAHKIHQGTGLQLSEQDLVDCSKSYGNQGCNGGWYHYAWNYVKANGISTLSAYPYAGREQACKSVSRGHKVSGYNSISASTGAIETEINKHPVAVAVDATNWSSYKSGIFSNCATSINHAVVAVGYVSGSHWLIRNSWGTGWGESGYMRLKTGNTCGVQSNVKSVNV